MWLHWEEEQSGLVIPMSNFEVLRGDLGLPDSQPFPPGLWLATQQTPSLFLLPIGDFWGKFQNLE